MGNRVMLVCHCKAIFERRIREEAASGARDEFDVAQACGAGSVCGGCVATISRLLDELGRTRSTHMDSRSARPRLASSGH